MSVHYLLSMGAFMLQGGVVVIDGLKGDNNMTFKKVILDYVRGPSAIYATVI